MLFMHYVWWATFVVASTGIATFDGCAVYALCNMHSFAVSPLSTLSKKETEFPMAETRFRGTISLSFLPFIECFLANALA